MRSLLSVNRTGVVDSFTQMVNRFESLWDVGNASLTQFWDDLGPDQSVSMLASLIKVELRRRFERGERPKAGDYFDRFPILIESRDRVVSLVYEEFCLLKEAGEDPDSQRFCDAYEPWRDSLISQLAYHRDFSQAIGAEPAPVRFPAPGERFGGFQLQSILGRGGVAQVYLATEGELGNRKVALKVASSFGQELSILANLDHRNIVPILTVVESESGLRGFCMPYRPGITLEGLIHRLGPGKPPRSAKAIWDQLKPTDSDESSENLAGWGSFPVRGTSSEAIAWIGLALANALIYLHGRGVLHRDIKPANILLARSEGPQLLDFNLSQDPNSPEQADAAMRGGTLPYMAPEQLQAFLDPVGWKSVDSSADIYSMGLVLRQLLTGLPPELPRPGTSLDRMIAELTDRRAAPRASCRDINPDIPPSLDAIIAKCLEFSTTDRYQSAADLAEDLGQFLARGPLVHAANSSQIERGVNWTHRHRRGVAMVALSLIVGCLVWVGMVRTPVPKLSTFRTAVRTLSSDRPRDWKKARDEFERLRQEYPESAYPLLNLGLTLEKIGGTEGLAANTILQNLVDLKLNDFAEALDAGLKRAPDSATLWSLKGQWHLNSREFSEARAAFTTAERLDPNRIYTLLGLVNVEREDHHEREAIEYCSRAIELAGRDEATYNMIPPLRAGIVPLLAIVANKIIAGRQTAADRDEARSNLDKLKANLEAMEHESTSLDASKGVKAIPFTLSFYRGCHDSSRAVLSGDACRWDEAYQFLDQARDHFLVASRVKSRYSKTPRLIEEQETLLEGRRHALDLAAESTDFRSVSRP